MREKRISLDLPRPPRRVCPPSARGARHDCSTYLKALVLGVVEGLTEFLPVSSTGHLLLVQRFFGFDDDDFGKTFAVLIQFGAILALLSIYFSAFGGSPRVCSAIRPLGASSSAC